MVFALVALATVLASLFAGPAQTASASTGLRSIICGGVKHGSGWETYFDGGYVGDGCGAQIDYVRTPTSVGTYSEYDFGYTDGRTYTLQAWIPWTRADAVMDFWVEVDCAGGYETGYQINENAYSAVWVTITKISPQPGCHVEVFGSTDMLVSSGWFMGLDAIRALT
jgi:hypothetical protein